jgi:malate dehydrogenase (quinone)
VKQGSIADPRSFIHPVPHMSFVHGAANASFLQKRFRAMTAHHCYYGMEYSEDRQKIATWAPLVMEGRADDEPVAATRIVTGTEVDYGTLTHHLVNRLSGLSGFAVHNRHHVTNIVHEPGGHWRVTVADTESSGALSVTAKFVFYWRPGALHCSCCRNPAFQKATAMPASASAASGCGAITPT